MDDLLTFLLQGRVAALNDKPDASGDFVLLWLQGQRRIRQSLAFAHAQRRANELHKPLVVYEGLRRDYPHASARFHQFILEGRAGTARDCAEQGVDYAFFLDTTAAPRGVLHRLAARASAVITDWLPAFIHPKQTRALAARARCRVEAVDAAGVAPVSLFPRAEVAARTLRPKLMKRLPELLRAVPDVPAKVKRPRRFDWGFDPFQGEPEDGVRAAGVSLEVPAADLRGGRTEALRRLENFSLRDYAEGRNDPSADVQSRLSPYLHFGYLAPAEIALAIRAKKTAAADKDAFIEELVVRRELALNFCSRVPEHDPLEAIPGWARNTLREHERDPRPGLPPDQELDAANSPNEIWNAMQTQLRKEGRIHGWMRMLWGKSLLLWTPNAGEALRKMAFLNDKYALDGRDAVSRTNFLWCLGLHDRPFPERPIFGTVRSMSLAAAAKRKDVAAYVKKWQTKV